MPVKTARAVQPNAGVEAWYRKTLQSLVREMSQDMLTRLRVAYPKGAHSHHGGLAADDVPGRTLLNEFGVIRMPGHETYEVGEDGFSIDETREWHPERWQVATDAKPRQPNLARTMEVWGGIWTRKLENLSVKIAWNFAAKNRQATDVGVKKSFQDAGLTVKFKPTRRMRSAFDATVAENVGLIKSIPQKYLTDVQTAVWQNVLKGSDLKTLTTTLQRKYAVTHRRAALIARDQNNKAKATFENVRRLEQGITSAIWQHSSAGVEPRPTHVAMNGKPYLLSEGVYDSSVGERIWPGQLINCRCTSRAVIEGFE